jgi:hypothetical protein
MTVNNQLETAHSTWLLAKLYTIGLTDHQYRELASSRSLTTANWDRGHVDELLKWAHDEWQLRLREMFTVLMSSNKYTEDAARELASNNLGIAWAE